MIGVFFFFVPSPSLIVSSSLDMRLVSVRPNHITFVGVLSACSHARMVKKALNYFEMTKGI